MQRCCCLYNWNCPWEIILYDRTKVSMRIRNTAIYFQKKCFFEIEKAKIEFKGYQEMVYEMEKDGLLNTKADYTIIYRDEELTINGKKQPAEVTNKFKKYFSKDGVTIRKEKGEMNINIQ